MDEFIVNVINDAILNRGRTLDLTGLGLNSQSPELTLLVNCTDLESLILNQKDDSKQIKTVDIGYTSIKYEAKSKRIVQRINENKFNTIPIVIKYLNNLKKLVIQGNEKAKILAVENLPDSLEIIDLKYNKISIVSLKHDNLKNLDLSYNKISEIVKLPKNLEVLNVEHNYIEIFQNHNENYIKLKSLNINYNNLVEFNLEYLPNLEILYCNNNKIKGILLVPKNARLIDASVNKIEKLIFNKNSSKVVLINLFRNKITTLPQEFFNSFENQTFEYLYEDQTIIRELKNTLVKSQMYEDAAETRYLEIELVDYKTVSTARSKYLLSIFTRGNNLSAPPNEIIFQGLNSIKNWFNSKRDYIKDVKIVLLGEPKSGKTSILNMLFYDQFNENEEQTDGINILEVDFRYNDYFKGNTKIHDVTGRVWDFGGQDILNSTHHCFLTNRSIYIVCLDSRVDTKVSSQIRYWLKRVKATAGDSPVLVLVNKIDINPGFQFENEKDIQKEFPTIVGFLRISCKTNDGIDLLRAEIEKTIYTHELINTTIDQNWILLKNKLLDSVQGKKYISENVFDSVCQDIAFKDKTDKVNAISFLNDLGIITHFNNNWIPKFYVFDPLWITYGLYQIVTSQLAAKNFGTIKIEDLNYIVNEEEDKTNPYNIHDYYKVKYTTNEVNYLMEVLLSFKLAYLSFTRDILIIPDLLSAKEPDELTNLFNTDDLIEIEYRYKFLPSNVLIELLINLNYVLSYSWRTGFVFKIDKNYCSVQSYDNSIFIKTSKNVNASESITIVRHHLSQINNKLTEQPKILVPLPDISVFVDLQELIGRLSVGEPIYKVYTPKVAEYEITKLLYGFELEPKFDTVLNKLKIIEDGQTKLFDLFSNFEGKLSDKVNEVVKEIRDDITKHKENLFENTTEQTHLMSKVDEILQKMNVKPDEELWHDKEPTTKLKAVLPLIIFRYEKELDITKIKIPKTWEEFKAWFIKQE